jgi:septal ring factor EnvC (AmiA/AmiB activator)
VEIPEWSTLIPGAGFFGLLVLLVLHLLRQSSGDRGDYQRVLREQREQHANEMKEERDQHADDIREITARHDAQIQDLRSQIAVLRAEVIDLRADVEEERRLRHKAEDELWKIRRQNGADRGGTDDQT